MVLDQLEHRGQALLPLPGFYKRLSVYGLLSLGLVLFSLALFMTPIFHRVLHRFHLEGKC